MKQEIREQEIIEQYQRWQECAVLDKDLKKELMEMAGKEEKIRDAFYKNLLQFTFNMLINLSVKNSTSIATVMYGYGLFSYFQCHKRGVVVTIQMID